MDAGDLLAMLAFYSKHEPRKKGNKR